MTIATNLVLSLSVATLGFQTTLLLNDQFMPIGWHRCIFSFSLLMAGLSVALGVYLVINRLRSFRATATAARKRECNFSEDEIEPDRQLYRRLDDRTWILFWFQVVTFGAGSLFTFISVLVLKWDKLF